MSSTAFVSSLISVNFWTLRKAESSQSKQLLLALNQLKQAQDQVVSIASQVAHDIRSPLAALNVASASLTDLSDENSLILKNATARVNDIINALEYRNLEKQVEDRTNELKTVLLPTLVDRIVSEKKIQFKNNDAINIYLDLQKTSYRAYVTVDEVTLERIISNLVNNSVEALSDKGEVVVEVSSNDHFAKFIVRDNGKGMSSETIRNVGNKGFTLGKKSGSGLGLYHAKSNIELWGGKLTIDSKLNEGTSVSCFIPLAPRNF